MCRTKQYKISYATPSVAVSECSTFILVKALSTLKTLKPGKGEGKTVADVEYDVIGFANGMTFFSTSLKSED